jgi:hypothetical protein
MNRKAVGPAPTVNDIAVVRVNPPPVPVMLTE